MRRLSSAATMSCRRSDLGTRLPRHGWAAGLSSTVATQARRVLRALTKGVFTRRLEPSDTIHCLFSQHRHVARDRDLPAALDVRHTTVERRDQLPQMTKSTRPVRFSAHVLVGYSALSSTRTTLAFDWGWALQARILPAAPRRAGRQLVAETAGLVMEAIERWVELAKAGEMRSSIPAKGHVADGTSAI